MVDLEKEEDSEIESVEKVLGSPVFCELNPHAHRLRTNLIVISALSIAIVLGDLRIDEGSSIFGLKIIGLDDGFLRNGLFCIVIYLICHFFWGSMESFQEWRIRLTGTRVAFVTTGRLSGVVQDYPNDPRQSTMYNWWREETKKIGHIGIKCKEMEKSLAKCELDLKNLIEAPQYNKTQNLHTAVQSTSQASTNINDLTRALNQTKTLFDSKRIPTSLRRFDRWFYLFLKTQNRRWLLLDFLFPIIVGIFALFLLGLFPKVVYLITLLAE